MDDIYGRYLNGKRNRNFEQDEDSLDDLELSVSHKLPRNENTNNESNSLKKVSINLHAISKEIEKMECQKLEKKSLRQLSKPLTLNLDFSTLAPTQNLAVDKIGTIGSFQSKEDTQ